MFGLNKLGTDVSLKDRYHILHHRLHVHIWPSLSLGFISKTTKPKRKVIGPFLAWSKHPKKIVKGEYLKELDGRNKSHIGKLVLTIGSCIGIQQELRYKECKKHVF